MEWGDAQHNENGSRSEFVVPESQPWRNPRPAPQLSEIQSRMGQPRAWNSLRAWWPAIAWACVIFSLSTDTFSAEHTASVFEPVLRWLIPSLTEDQFLTIHYFIRKSAHFSEYFVFCLLLYRGVRGGRKGWRWTWGIAALSVAAGYSVLDEIHQAFVASRTASAYDSLLDSVGAFAALAFLWLWFRWRRTTSSAGIAAGESPSI
jgi:VanZ family protein